MNIKRWKIWILNTRYDEINFLSHFLFWRHLWVDTVFFSLFFVFGNEIKSKMYWLLQKQMTGGFFYNIFFTDIFNILFMILSLNSHPKVLQLNYDSDRFTTTIYSTCLWKTVNLCVNSKPWICFAHKYWYFIAKYLG